MVRSISVLLFAFSIFSSWTVYCDAQINRSSMPQKDSKDLMINDILMLMLGEEIEKAVSDYYSPYLTQSPKVYPYQIKIVNVERVGEFRTFHFLITLETTPVVGPHISVGKDKLTFEIIPGRVRLKQLKHLESHQLPLNWQYIIKRK